jgi:hypothetical protein
MLKIFKKFNVNEEDLSTDKHKQGHSIYDSEDDSEVRKSSISNNSNKTNKEQHVQHEPTIVPRLSFSLHRT